MKVTAKYTTKQTAVKYGLLERIDDFIEMMADFEKTVKVGPKYVEIIDNESGETIDFAHFIIVNGVDGEKYGEILLSEMESVVCAGYEGNREISASTIFEEIEINGFPYVN